ncbi:VCBS repeat-containing protein [Leptolyngbya boryana CZ1]|uniref:VCBS repeat-containing protein n=1 Tax=Leptolyngbya boryana CZ1 TaxID=3060204 RepID=A0AA97AN63_LEPBY|nr:VCBS repeat-containing protein [Leptolyngbya boryana]WNZ43764.1 VCBS repeat-containing protein [Leptolyngbya boryana CZ1]
MNSSSISLDWQIRQVGDLDGDRKSDLVWTNSTTGEAAIWLMEGSTMRSGQIIAAGLGLQLTYSGDLDGDGKTDLVWRNPTNGDVLLWLMDGLTRRSAQTFQVGTAWQVQTVADVNGDNRADLIWRSVSSNEAAVWIMNGTTVTQADFLPTVSGAWTGGVRRGRLYQISKFRLQIVPLEWMLAL